MEGQGKLKFPKRASHSFRGMDQWAEDAGSYPPRDLSLIGISSSSPRADSQSVSPDSLCAANCQFSPVVQAGMANNTMVQLDSTSASRDTCKAQ